MLQVVDIPEMKQTRKDYNSDVFRVGAKSYEKWAAKQNNVDVFILDELLYPIKDMKITVQRYHAMEIGESIYLMVINSHFMITLMVDFKYLIKNINIYMKNC